MENTYQDNTTTSNYPKTLLIRNEPGGMIWQVYQVQKESEASKLSANAMGNGFHSRTLVDYTEDYDETFPDWRDTDGGKRITE